MAKTESQPAARENRMFVLALGLLVGFVLAFVLFLSRVPVDGAISQNSNDPFDNGEMSNLSFDYYSVLEGQKVARGSELETSATNNPTVVFVEPVERVESANVLPRIITQTPAQKPAEIESVATAPQVPQPTRIQQTPARVSTTDSYYLEAGSYQNNEDAVQIQSQLLKMGLQAFVVVRQDAGGNFGHRVRVGPLLEQVQLDSTRDRLRASGITPSLIKVKQ